MQSQLRILYLLAAISLPSAFAGGPGDNFLSLLEVRKLEETHALKKERRDIEPGQKSIELKSISARLTQARIERNGFLQEQEGARRPASIPSKQIHGLSVPEARKLSTFEWQVLSELYGSSAQENLLNRSFALENLPPASRHENARVIWITNTSFPILSAADSRKENEDRKQSFLALKKLGYQVEELMVGPYTRMDDLADDLQKHLRLQIEGAPAYLVSQGGASAVVFHTLDLFPDLGQRKEILGWVNLNGKLYGQDKRQRSPASVKNLSPADRQKREIYNETLKVREERLDRQAPLGVKFPILSLVSTESGHRPASNLRESIVPDGKVFFLKKGSGHPEIGAALTALTDL